MKKQPCRGSCDLLKIISPRCKNSEKWKPRAFLSQLLLGPPHFNFRLRSTNINSMGGTFKCPQGPTSNLDNCCAPGWPAERDSDNGNMEGTAVSWVDTSTLTLSQNHHGESSLLVPELPVVISKARNPNFCEKRSHFLKLAIGSNLHL